MTTAYANLSVLTLALCLYAFVLASHVNSLKKLSSGDRKLVLQESNEGARRDGC